MVNNKWWTNPRRVIQPILRTCDGNVNVKSMVDELYEFGCNTILQNAAGIMAWYDTKVAYHQKPEGMKSDVLKDILEQAHSHNMKVITRFDMSGLRYDAYSEHPEWFYRDIQGNPMIDKGLYATCLSSTFFDEFFLPIFDEILENYDIDGVFLNMFGYRDRDRRGVYHGPCHCPKCQRYFKEKYNLPLPKHENLDDLNYLKYIEFREGMFEFNSKQIYDYIKKKGKDIAFFDGRGNKAPVAIINGYGDATEMEIHWMSPHPNSSNGLQQSGWRYMAGESCRLVRTLGEEFSSIINVFQAGGGRFEAHSKGWMNTALAQAVANGGWPFVAFVGTPWMEDRKTEDSIKKFYSFVAENEEYYTNLQSTAKIALVWSNNNTTMHLGRTDFMESFTKHFRGWYSTLIKAHYEFDIIDDSQLSIDKSNVLLKKYKLLIMPNVALLNDTACKNIDRFVEEGGKLVTTYETSLFDEKGNKRDNFGLSCLGIEKILEQRKNIKNAFFRNNRDCRFPSLDKTNLIMVNGGLIYPVLKHDAEVSFNLVAEIEYASPEQENIETETNHPGVVFYKSGKGQTVYFPWEIDKLAYQFGMDDYISVMEDIIYSLMRDDLVLETDASSWVEVTLHYQENEKRLILQLVNESGHDGVEFRNPVIMKDINFKIKTRGINSVKSMALNQEIIYEVMDDWIKFTLPIIKLYDLIIIE